MERLLGWFITFVLFCLHCHCLIPGSIHSLSPFPVCSTCSGQSELTRSVGHCSLCFWNSLPTWLNLTCSSFKAHIVSPLPPPPSLCWRPFQTTPFYIISCYLKQVALNCSLNCCLIVFPLSVQFLQLGFKLFKDGPVLKIFFQGPV